MNASHHSRSYLEPDYDLITMRTLQRLGVSGADHALGATIYEALRVRSMGTRTLFPDTLTTLARLKARGYVLGIVSNRHYGGEKFIDDLRQMGLLTFFDARHLAISADLRYRKPHSGIFQHALDGLGIHAAASAMVGDNLVADIWGGQQLGMFTIWKPKPRLRKLSHQHWLESSLLDGIDPTQYPMEEAFLFTWAREQGQEHEPRVHSMTPPDAIIAEVGDLLKMFPGYSDESSQPSCLSHME
jgi:FMN phosphatase YigB (HAD superfamily)